MEILINRGASLSATDNSGNTPLDWAVSEGRSETARLIRRHMEEATACPPDKPEFDIPCTEEPAVEEPEVAYPEEPAPAVEEPAEAYAEEPAPVVEEPEVAYPEEPAPAVEEPAEACTEEPAPVVEEPEEPGYYYVVQRGDTVATIARKHKIPVRKLLELNNMNEYKARRIRPGMKLKVGE